MLIAVVLFIPFIMNAQNSATVVVNDLPTITLDATAIATCQGTTTADLTYSATTESPTTYSIDFNAAANTAGFVDVTDAAFPASPISVSVPGAGAVGTYNAVFTVSNATCSSADYAITIEIKAVPSVSGTTPASSCV